MNIHIKNNVIKSIDGRIKYKVFRLGGKEHFHLGVWIDGDERDLDQVLRVEYQLHSSFKNRNRFSQDRKNNFSITFWTWGMFNIHIILHLQDNQTHELDYYLEYELPPDDGHNYVKVK